MGKRLVLLQFGSATLGRIIAAILQGVSLLLIARAVSPADFGLLSSVIGVAWVLQTVFDLGSSTFIVHERSRNRNSCLVPAALWLNDRLSLSLCLVSSSALLLLSMSYDPSFIYLLPLSGWMAAERNADAWLGVAFADGDWRVNLTNMVGKRVASVLVLFALLLSPLPPVLSFTLSWAVPSLVSSRLARRHVTPLLPPTYVKFPAKMVIQSSWPYWLNSMSVQASNLDVSVVGLSAGHFQAGIFAAASRLTGPLRILPTSLARAMLPAASRSHSFHDRVGLLRMSALMLSAITFVYLTLFFTVPYALPPLLGSDYLAAVRPLQAVLLGLPFAAGTSMVGAILQGIGHKRYVAHVALLSTAAYLTALPLLVMQGGALGAALALASSYAFQFIANSLKYVIVEIRSRNVRASLTPQT